MKLWEASPARKDITSMKKLWSFIEDKYQISFKNYDEFHRWSVEEKDLFWSELFDFFNLRYEGELSPAYTRLDFLDYPWFPLVKMNFSENLLAHGNSQQTALTFVHESGKRKELSYQKLKAETVRLENYLQRWVKADDVVAAYLPNLPETVITMLATASLGGVFTSTSADFGVKGVLDRFGQSRPKVLVTTNAYTYNGKTFDITDRLQEIVAELDSIEKVIVVDFLEQGFDTRSVKNSVNWLDIPDAPGECRFLKRPFSAAQYIMYSSGTTGKPKCIVHSQGGTLLQHVKELGLHTDLNANKTIMYFTTCGWMMWNWLISSLAFGANIILYEGSPGHPSLQEFFDIIDREKIHIFGTSPKFLKAFEDSGADTSKSYETLETILSTGAPLLPEQFDFVYQLKQDVLLASICGGTDIIGCFMLGNPLLPVYRGDIQCLGLGMDVYAYDNKHKPIYDAEGELVCATPFPSQPIGFLNDKQHAKFKAAYFEKIPNVWHHGDYITITKDKTVKVFGRSDATLNPGGVRIGTAEIYRQTEQLNYIEDSLCVGKQTDGDVDVWLFIKLKSGEELSDERINEIKTQIKANTTPRHVPKKIYTIHDIPYTRSGKKMELAVTRILNHKPLSNIEAVANPECLDEYQKYV